MNKWVALNGNFEEISNKIIFRGGIIPSLEESTNTEIKLGILIFDESLSTGSIEMTVEFETLEDRDEAQILFNYKNSSNYICAGINNNKYAKFEYKYIDNGQWYFEKYAGFSNILPKKKYNIKVDIFGSLITLYIDNIKVITILSKIQITNSNIGLFTRSKNNIIFSSFKSDYKKPKAFVISQFGKDYDDLYNDVIKPVCEKQKFDTIRADEINTSTLILNDIIESIQNSSLVIADISPNNPNVFYEVGYSHAINKPTILLCDKSLRSLPPFDVSGFRTIFYDNSIGGKKIVEEKLTQYIQNINKITPLGYSL